MYDNSHVEWPGVVNPWLKDLKKISSFLLPMAALALALPVSLSSNRAALAQVPNVPSAQNLPTDLPPPRDVLPPTSPPQEPEPVPSLPPSPGQLLPNQNQSPQQQEKLPQVVPETYKFDVKGFDFEEGTVFQEEQLLRAMEVFLNNPEQELVQGKDAVVDSFKEEEVEAIIDALSDNPEKEIVEPSDIQEEVVQGIVEPSDIQEKLIQPQKDYFAKPQSICDKLSDKPTQEPSENEIKLPQPGKYPPIQMSFAQLLRARLGITQLYICKGYITSGAVIPAEQDLEKSDGVVKIRLVEGSLEDIKIIGNKRLDDSYIRSRLERANKKPLNQEHLLDALRLLQQNPRFENLSADLAAGSRLGTNVLEVNVKEANTSDVNFILDNSRSPSVGSLQGSAQYEQTNLSGIGDTISVLYAKTRGSNKAELSYTLPLSSQDTELSFKYGFNSNNIIEEPFDELDIESESDNYELSLRHPVIKTSKDEVALGLTLSHQRTQTFLGKNDIGGFPLSPGADDEGRTRVSALRFSQEWTRRGDNFALALRSQFNLGLNIFDATISDQKSKFEPDSQFFTWRGQAQWVQSLTKDKDKNKNTLLVLRGGVQFAPSGRLLSLEKFGVGGALSVRGYRQDQLLRDNGLFASAEVRLPILRIPKSRGVLQVIPFLDVGTAWNSYEVPEPGPSTLVSAGLGLNFQINNLNARLDYGIPLVPVDEDDENEKGLQEQGLYFSLQWKAFSF